MDVLKHRIQALETLWTAGGSAESSLQISVTKRPGPNKEWFLRQNVEPTKHPRRKFTKDHIRFYNYSKTGYYINVFPSDNVISKMQCPCTLVTGTIYYNLHCRLECGFYEQPHEDNNSNMLPRMIGSLVLFFNR